MPCRCCNWSGSCASDVDCAPGRPCCSGTCGSKCQVAAPSDVPYPPPFFYTETDGTSVYSIARNNEALFTASLCGVTGNTVQFRINNITSGSKDFYAIQGGMPRGGLYDEDSNFIGDSTAPVTLTVSPSGTASVYVSLLYFSNRNDTRYFEAEFYQGDISCKQKVRITPWPVPIEPVGGCCVDGVCTGITTQANCAGTWLYGVDCAETGCNVTTPTCSGGPLSLSWSGPASSNQNCVITQYNQQAVQIPSGCNWVNITGSADDLLLVDGFVRGRGSAIDGRQAGGSGIINNACQGAGAVSYTFQKTGSFTVAAGDTSGTTAAYSLTIRFSSTGAFSLPAEVRVLSSGGVGTELKALLAKLGITTTPTCQCNKRAKEMDDRGVQWCRENEELILSWLKEESDRRGLPFVALAAKMLIRRAVRNAEKKANSQ